MIFISSMLVTPFLFVLHPNSKILQAGCYTIPKKFSKSLCLPSTIIGAAYRRWQHNQIIRGNRQYCRFPLTICNSTISDLLDYQPYANPLSFFFVVFRVSCNTVSSEHRQSEALSSANPIFHAMLTIACTERDITTAITISRPN